MSLIQRTPHNGNRLGQNRVVGAETDSLLAVPRDFSDEAEKGSKAANADAATQRAIYTILVGLAFLAVAIIACVALARTFEKTTPPPSLPPPPASNGVTATALRDAAAAADYVYPTYREPFSPVLIMGFMRQIEQAFFANDTRTTLTIPFQNWTGNSNFPARGHQASETIVPGNLTGDRFAEVVIGLTYTLYRTMNHNERDGVWGYPLENDVQQAGMERDPRMAFYCGEVAKLIAKVEATVVSINSGAAYAINGKPITVDRFFGFRLLVNIFTSLSNHHADPNLWLPVYLFGEFYSGTRHRGLIQEYFTTYRSQDNVHLSVGDDFMFWPRSQSFNLYGPSYKNRAFAIPDSVRRSAERARLIADAEEDAYGKYFYTGYIFNISGAAIFNDAVDPEGAPRAVDQTPFVWTDTDAYMVPWNLPTPGKPDNSMYANFTKLNVTTVTGGNSYQYVGTSSHLVSFHTFPDAVKGVLGDEVAAKLLIDKIAHVYDTYVIPQNKRFGAALRRRITNDQLVQDYYIGKWRSKMQRVNLVTRNHVSGRAIAFDIPCNATLPMGTQLRIPVNATFNSVYAANNTCGITSAAAIVRFQTAQAGIVEMERWMTNNLEVSVDAHVGDTYLVLRKNNLTRGVGPGKTPYTDIEQLLFNYVASEKTVKPYGQVGDLPDLVAESGYALVDIFVDIQEFLGNQLAKEQYQFFNFTTLASAGLYNVNNQSVTVTREMTNARAVQVEEGAVSDVEYLGRHYGYYADGAPGYPAETMPMSNTGAGSLIPYKYYPFDYIYRQHYAYNSSLPMTASNVNDPITGKYKYQFTDSNDTSRRAAFLTAFNLLETTTIPALASGKSGTYFRWRYDWITQKMARYIVNTAVAKGLLEDDFIQTFFNSTLYDTNEPSTLAATGPERCTFRVYAQLSGSANSGGSIDTVRKFFNVTIRFSTPVPTRTLSSLGTILHEGALGHGFDRVPNAIAFLRGTPDERAWPSNLGGVNRDESGILERSHPTPSYGSLAEGWATLGEILGILKSFYCKFDLDGRPIPETQDTNAALQAIISLARIAARQVLVVTQNFARYAGSFNNMLALFKRLTGFSTKQSVGFMDRFATHPTQQASYANGFITNVGLISYIRSELVAQNLTFVLAKYIQFRITRTDYIVGGSLFEIANQNIYAFSAEYGAKKKKRDDNNDGSSLMKRDHHFFQDGEYVIQRNPLPENLPAEIVVWDDKILD